MGRWLCAILFGLVGLAGSARAQILDREPKVHASLIAEQDEIAPGGTVWVALEEIIRPGWHTYWVNPGDAGAPTQIKWSLPSGWKAGDIAWPYPKRLPVGHLMDYGYENRVRLLVPVTAPKDASGVAHLSAKADWLVCEQVCVPESALLSLDLAVSEKPSPPYATVEEDFAAARAFVPKPSPWPAVFHSGRTLDLYLADKSLAKAKLKSVTFFPLQYGIIADAEPQLLGTASSGIVLRLSLKTKAPPPQLGGVVVLTSRDGAVQAVSVAAKAGAVPEATFDESVGLGVALAVLFAFLGGLILNAMPCVLPVLAMKAVTIAAKAGADRAEVRRESFAYGLGAVLTFLTLGGMIVLLRSAGETVGWGFQLQMPIVVAALSFLMFAVALNLSGLFTFAGSLAMGDSLARRGGAVGAFFTGVLAVGVAAPCTAPFMAAALGYALTEPATVSLLVFAALGLGFSLPFVMIGISPGVLRLLPKPGPWMTRLRQILALPMYGAAVWLLWVLVQETDGGMLLPMLSGYVLLAVSLWVWSAQRAGQAARRLSVIGMVAGLSSLAFIPVAPSLKQSASVEVSGLVSQPYSARRLTALRQRHKAVFVNATAAWCITCLVNEKAALSAPRVREAFERQGTIYMVADWTNRNPEITELLQSHGRDGVPLYLYFARDAAQPKVLPQILTPQIVAEAVEGR